MREHADQAGSYSLTVTPSNPGLRHHDAARGSPVPSPRPVPATLHDGAGQDQTSWAQAHLRGPCRGVHTTTPVQLLTSSALSPRQRDDLVKHLCWQSRQHDGTSDSDPAGAALRDHLLPAGPATLAQVEHLRASGTAPIAACAAAHRFTPAAQFRATMVSVTADSSDPGQILACAASHTTDQRRLRWLLQQAKPDLSGTAWLLLDVAQAPTRALSSPVLMSLLNLLNDFQHCGTEEDFADEFALTLFLGSAGRARTLNRAIALFMSSNPHVHPSVVGALLRSADDAQPQLLEAAAGAICDGAVLRCHADHGSWCHLGPVDVLGRLLTAPSLSAPARARLRELVRAHAESHSPLLALAHKADGSDPAVVASCDNRRALRALADVWWPLPPAHLFELAAHPLLTDEHAARVVADADFSAAQLADLFTVRRPTPTFRATLWQSQTSTLGLPLSLLSSADVAELTVRVASGNALADARRIELGAVLAGLSPSQVRALPWRGAWSCAELSDSFAATLTAELEAVLTERGLAVLSGLAEFSGTVAELATVVTAATSQ